jgi:PTS system nitrogen regulatory IIA component
MDLTVRAVAAIFNVPEGRIYRWIHEDDLPTREVNGQQYFNRTELLEWATVRRVRFSADLFQDPAGGPEADESLIEALQVGGIVAGLDGSDKREILRAVVDRMHLPESFDRSVLYQLLLAREAVGATAVGDGIAIPHPRHPVILPVGRTTVTLCFLERPVDFGFGTPDSQPVHTLFVLVSPTIRAHLRMLARIACALRDEPLRAVLKRRGAPEEILGAIRRMEASYRPNPVDSGESA